MRRSATVAIFSTALVVVALIGEAMFLGALASGEEANAAGVADPIEEILDADVCDAVAFPPQYSNGKILASGDYDCSKSHPKVTITVCLHPAHSPVILKEPCTTNSASSTDRVSADASLNVCVPGFYYTSAHGYASTSDGVSKPRTVAEEVSSTVLVSCPLNEGP